MAAEDNVLQVHIVCRGFFYVLAGNYILDVKDLIIYSIGYRETCTLIKQNFKPLQRRYCPNLYNSCNSIQV